MPVIEAGGAELEAALQRTVVNTGAPNAGDFNGQAEKGQLLIDTTNGVLYINVGTKASTTWVVVGSQS